VQGLAPRRAFERLLMDLIHGQQAHFVRNDELVAAWKVLHQERTVWFQAVVQKEPQSIYQEVHREPRLNTV
jgi:glucose-6-phosphate 1-dehydrogenase